MAFVRNPFLSDPHTYTTQALKLKVKMRTCYSICLLENPARSVLCARFVSNCDFCHDPCMDTWISYCEDLDKTSLRVSDQGAKKRLCFCLADWSKSPTECGHDVDCSS
eukprot:TRINITY_DN83_c0_g1_i22.p1 TRINITY_DN83_c0_g1~~TRINITY_DN83_c0_g1_i22.p1  ORF type:complete len:108 (-),score=9.08 TRINITY_DN83_c0_g1_i22:52-375(-)